MRIDGFSNRVEDNIANLIEGDREVTLQREKKKGQAGR